MTLRFPKLVNPTKMQHEEWDQMFTRDKVDFLDTCVNMLKQKHCKIFFTVIFLLNFHSSSSDCCIRESTHFGKIKIDDRVEVSVFYN